MLKMDTEHQVTDAVGRLFDKDSRQTAQKACGDAEQQHELLVGEVRGTPLVETFHPLAELLFCHGSFVFLAAKIKNLFLSSHHKKPEYENCQLQRQRHPRRYW